MSGHLIGYAPPVRRVHLPGLGHHWPRLLAWARRRDAPVYAVRIPRFTDIPPT
jgi:hypothetical protein